MSEKLVRCKKFKLIRSNLSLFAYRCLRLYNYVMIWIVFFFVIILISSVLAYRSMKDYEEIPDSMSLNALFYVSSPQYLNESLSTLHRNFLNQKFFSIERLIKGDEKAIVLFAERSMKQDFPKLGLVEIEDYLADQGKDINPDQSKITDVNSTISWLLEPKSDPKKALEVKDEFRNLSLENDQKVFFQMVLMPMGDNLFQSTLRVMVTDPDPASRVQLAKDVNRLISESIGLTKHEDNYPESKKFESFRQRTLVPKEVSEFYLSHQEVIDLLT